MPRQSPRKASSPRGFLSLLPSAIAASNEGADRYVLLFLATRWSSLVGRSNRKMMVPVELKKETLVVAVPNSMVKSIVYPTIPILLKKINAEGGRLETVSRITLRVRPDLFTRHKQPEKHASTPENTLSEEQIDFQTRELMRQRGFSEKVARALVVLRHIANTKHNTDK